MKVFYTVLIIFLGNFATDIIGSCAFGLEINSFTDPNNPFRLMGRKIFLRSPVGNLKFLLVSNFPSIGRLLKLKLLDPEVTKFFTKVVIDTVNYREKNNVQRHDFLQLLIDMKNNKDTSEQPGKLLDQQITVATFNYTLRSLL